MSVMIVDDPSKGIAQDNIIHHNGQGQPCKHLQKDGDQFSCSIHDKDWYDETPCFSHGQMEKSAETPCRLGKYMLANPNILAHALKGNENGSLARRS